MVAGHSLEKVMRVQDGSLSNPEESWAARAQPQESRKLPGPPNMQTGEAEAQRGRDLPGSQRPFELLPLLHSPKNLKAICPKLRESWNAQPNKTDRNPKHLLSVLSMSYFCKINKQINHLMLSLKCRWK